MSVISSLTNRIFFATALLAVLSIATAVYIVNRAVTRQAEDELQRGVYEAAGIVADYRQLLFDNFARDARLIADLPVLKAAVDTHDPATLAPIAEKYQKALLPTADLFAITDNRGLPLVRLGTSGVPAGALTAAVNTDRESAAERNTFWPEAHGVLLIKSVPITPDKEQAELLGTLILGARLDEQQAVRFKTLTNSEVAFGVNGAIQAATLPRETWPALVGLLDTPRTATRIVLNRQDYLAYATPLSPL